MYRTVPPNWPISPDWPIRSPIGQFDDFSETDDSSDNCLWCFDWFELQLNVAVGVTES